MKYYETLEYIHSLGAFSHEAGLDRIGEVCCRLNNPQNNFKCIHVAGTNGKGSVCTFISSVLKCAGYKVGIFVSPYITDFCERIQINGEYISRDDLCRLSKQVIDTNVTLTEFEFITAVGFLYFNEKKIDIAVIETGLGGRFDATNIISAPIVSVITKIGLDHTAILGDTIEQIAKEKCGIIKSNTVVTCANQTKAVIDTIKHYAPKVIIPKVDELNIIKSSLLGNEFRYKNSYYKTLLGGDFQIENALVAIETLKNSGLNICDTDIEIGLQQAFIPARLEVVSQNPLIVLDGAHNPDGADALCPALCECKNITAIVGVMCDKNYEEVLSKTLPLCKNVICTKPNVPRALPVDELFAVAEKHCQNVFKANDLQNALALAKSKSGGGPIFVFGSLYLSSEIRTLL